MQLKYQNMYSSIVVVLKLSEYTLFAVIFAAVTFIPTNGVIVPVAFDKLVESENIFPLMLITGEILALAIPTIPPVPLETNVLIVPLVTVLAVPSYV
jgi:hypothetical protein